MGYPCSTWWRTRGSTWCCNRSLSTWNRYTIRTLSTVLQEHTDKQNQILIWFERKILKRYSNSRIIFKMNEHETMKIHEMFYNLNFSGDGGGESHNCPGNEKKLFSGMWNAESWFSKDLMLKFTFNIKWRNMV